MYVNEHYCSLTINMKFSQSVANGYRTAQNCDRGNIDKFDEFPVIRQYFPIKIFHLVSYLPLMNL